MSKQTNTILVIGAGPIIIGQGCEFDYSGTQACKILKKEGYRVVLVNSNPATIMTDPDTADAVYLEPITPEFVTSVIKKEKPDALLPTMGGQVALNCALSLAKQGILEKYNIKLLGASIETIENAEDRKKFKAILQNLQLDTPQCAFIHSMEEAQKLIEQFSFPVIIRPSFTLGGTGGGIAHDLQTYLQLCEQGLSLSPIQQIMVDESLIGWKEFELEVMRDKNNNCAVICTIENIDPMGVHTGDSITVAPAMTLTDKEYQTMRVAAFQILHAVGLETGGANIQFAIHPQTGRMVVIEMNPRVSRSSALASKATGYPIAKIAAQLAIGYTLPELMNEITGKFPAAFEPALDYVVVKIPRFNFDKFPETSSVLTTQMKSVGEVMAIGSTFQAALQKAMQSLEISGDEEQNDLNHLKNQLAIFHPKKLWHLLAAFKAGLSVAEIHAITKIDPWFLTEIQDLTLFQQALSYFDLKTLPAEILLESKRKGLSDEQIAQILQCDEKEIFILRKKLQILSIYKKVDTCAGEFQAQTGYFYSCYEDECEASSSDKQKVIVIGSGPNRIGQGIEFDYSCVHALQAIKSCGYEAIMINCNPETVSTDYDIADKLYFEPLSFEHVAAVIEKEQPLGVIAQLGGQTSLKLIKKLDKLGIPLLGTSAKEIDTAENRDLFRSLLMKLNLKQPPNITINHPDEFNEKIKSLSFPIIIRPSNILGGQAMVIIKNQQDCASYFTKNKIDVEAYPLLVEEFLEDAIEVEVDAISDGNDTLLCGLLEHIEPAGVHSGDSACQFPSTLPTSLQDKIYEQVKLLAQHLKIIGFLNVQFAIKNNEIYIIEANPRASRTLPFLAKATQISWAKLGILCMLGKKIKNFEIKKSENITYSIKEAVFPFNKLPSANFLLGPQMKSTGEVMSSSHCPDKAFIKAQQAAGYKLQCNQNDKVLILNYSQKPEKLYEIAQSCLQLQLEIVADGETGSKLKEKNIYFEALDFTKINHYFYNKKISCFLFLDKNNDDEALKKIMEKSIHHQIYYASTSQAALRFVTGLKKLG